MVQTTLMGQIPFFVYIRLQQISDIPFKKFTFLLHQYEVFPKLKQTYHSFQIISINENRCIVRTDKDKSEINYSELNISQSRLGLVGERKINCPTREKLQMVSDWKLA